MIPSAIRAVRMALHHWTPIVVLVAHNEGFRMLESPDVVEIRVKVPR